MVPQHVTIRRASGEELGQIPLYCCPRDVVYGFCYGCELFYDHVTEFELKVVSQTWDRLLEESLWDLAMPRCYLFSEGDNLICFKEIEDHAAALRRLGARVESVNFKISGHVQHARLDPEKYRSAISNVWQLNQF